MVDVVRSGLDGLPVVVSAPLPVPDRRRPAELLRAVPAVYAVSAGELYARGGAVHAVRAVRIFATAAVELAGPASGPPVSAAQVSTFCP
jgi:hypothetical protein